jgi:quinohemoprotein ethanol dehydrogenase
LTAAETFTPNPGNPNSGLRGFGGNRGGGQAVPAPPLASPAPYGPIRRGADGNPVRGGILTAWDPVTQKERWFAMGGGQTDGGVLTTASNLVVQTTPQGRLLGYTADKGEQMLDVALPITTGVGPPITYLLDGKQYIAVMAGTGVMAGRGGGGAGRGQAPQEPTAAAAERGNAPAAPPQPLPQPPGAQRGGPPNPPANPKLFVYTLSN